MKDYAPIVIPTLCRYEHFKNCIESLQKNIDADKTELYIAIDFPSNDKYVDGNKKIKEYVQRIEGFKAVNIFVHKVNMGAIGNSHFVINKAIEKHGKFIYSEDDNVFGKSFIKYINFGFSYSEYDKNVIAICGYAYPFMEEYDAKIVRQTVACPAWGYAMRGDKFRELNDYIKTGALLKNMEDESLREKVRLKSPYNYRLLMSACRSYPPDKCWEYFTITDLSLSAYMLMHDKAVLMPRKSLVRNNGWDGSGEHITTDKRSELQRFDYASQEIDGQDIVFKNKDVKDLSIRMQNKWSAYTDEGFSLRKKIDMWIKNYIYIMMGDKMYQFIKRNTRFKS